MNDLPAGTYMRIVGGGSNNHDIDVVHGFVQFVEVLLIGLLFLSLKFCVSFAVMECVVFVSLCLLPSAY